MFHYKERLKSFVLITFCLLAFILTKNVLYRGSSDGGFFPLDTSLQIKSPQTYIIPQSYFVGFGGISYTRVYHPMVQEKIGSQVTSIFVDALSKDYEKKEISRLEYIQATSGESILLTFFDHLYIQDFLSLHGQKNSKISPQIQMKEILLNSKDNHSIYFYDAHAEQYYKIYHTDDLHDVSSLVRSVAIVDNIEYRRITDRFSLAQTIAQSPDELNYQLIPYQYDRLVPYFAVETQSPYYQQKSLMNDSAAKYFFGNRMGFVKHMNDAQGSNIFMYGYGDKVLTRYSNGRLVYQERNETKAYESAHFHEALSIATEAIGHLENIPSSLFLDYYEQKDDTFYFYFNYKVNQYVVQYSSKDEVPLLVIVKGKQLVYLDKNIVLPKAEPFYQGEERLKTVDECLTMNFDYIASIYHSDEGMFSEPLDNMLLFYKIRTDIHSIEMVYYVTETHFMPSWKIVIRNHVYYFDVYTGEILTKYKLEGVYFGME